MSLKLQKAEALSNKIEKVKKDQIEVAKSLSLEVEQKKKAMERVLEDRLLSYEKTYVTSKETLKTINHQMEMFIKDFNRLDKEQNMTDFYLNKVLPVTNFTQMMTTFRSFVDEEEQLTKLKEV